MERTLPRLNQTGEGSSINLISAEIQMCTKNPSPSDSDGEGFWSTFVIIYLER